jgi:phosphoribosylanthranilate isomerase
MSNSPAGNASVPAQFVHVMAIPYSIAMEPTLVPRVKICCIKSVAEAQMAIRAGADAVGLVGRMPSGPGVIDDAQAAAIARAVPPPVATFILTSAQSVREIVDHHARVRSSVIQLVDELREGSYAELRALLPGVKLVQVIHVTGAGSIESAGAAGAHVDAVLLDSGRPDLAVKELGGTGRPHDWSISRRIRETLDVPVFLAGGLNPENVAEAIASVGPFAVDVCSGVRIHGLLDEEKLRRFMKETRS